VPVVTTTVQTFEFFLHAPLLSLKRFRLFSHVCIVFYHVTQFSHCMVCIGAHACRHGILSICHNSVVLIVPVEDCQISCLLCVCVCVCVCVCLCVCVCARIHLQSNVKASVWARTNALQGERYCARRVGIVSKWNQHTSLYYVLVSSQSYKGAQSHYVSV
jgi:hypothetical protein